MNNKFEKLDMFGINVDVEITDVVQIAEVVWAVYVDVFVFKFIKCPVVHRNKEVAESQHNNGHDGSTYHVRPQHPAVADAATQDGNNFGIAGHLRGEENHADEDEQWAVEVDKARDEIEVIRKNDFLERSVSAKEIVKFFRYVEGDNDDNDKCHRQQKSLQILEQYVSV